MAGSGAMALLLAFTLGGGLLRSADTPSARGTTAAGWESVASPSRIASRLADGERSHADRVAAFARRYGIGPQLSRQIYEAARAERVSPALAFGLVRVESGFDPDAVGAGGAIGLTQIRPATARELAPRVSSSDLRSPGLNLQLGFRYLHTLLERFDQDVAVALAAYNRGPGHVQAQLARGRPPAGAYAHKVLRNIERGSEPTL